MTKKIKTILVISVLSILLIFIGYKLITQKEPVFNSIKFDPTIVIKNKTDKLYYDTIVQCGLQVLNIDSVEILIDNLENARFVNINDYVELKATIEGRYNIFINGYNQFILYISDLNKNEAVTVISHELIHLKQYHDGRLKILPGICLWNGAMFDVNMVSYENRPWEIEAFSEQNDLRDKIENKLLR